VRLHLRRITAIANETYGREGDALTQVATVPSPVSRYLQVASERRSDPARVYAELWGSKGTLSRINEYRSLSARAAATDPQTVALLAERTPPRRRRAELLLAPEFKDPTTRKKRDDDLKALTEKIATADKALRPRLPILDRLGKLTKATSAD